MAFRPLLGMPPEGMSSREAMRPAPPRMPRRASGRWRRLLTAVSLLLLACAGTPVAGNAVSIGAIQGDPRTWVGKRVVIEGQVTHTMSLLLARYFTLDDGTGTMNVLTDKPLPARGQRLRVTGKVSDFFSFGSDSTLILMEEAGETPPPQRAAVPTGGFRQTLPP